MMPNQRRAGIDADPALLETGCTVWDGRWIPIRVAPQCAVLSPMLKNVYLHPVDVQLRQSGYELVSLSGMLETLRVIGEVCQCKFYTALFMISALMN